MDFDFIFLIEVVNSYNWKISKDYIKGADTVKQTIT